MSPLSQRFGRIPVLLVAAGLLTVVFLQRPPPSAACIRARGATSPPGDRCGGEAKYCTRGGAMEWRGLKSGRPKAGCAVRGSEKGRPADDLWAV